MYLNPRNKLFHSSAPGPTVKRINHYIKTTYVHNVDLNSSYSTGRKRRGLNPKQAGTRLGFRRSRATQKHHLRTVDSPPSRESTVARMSHPLARQDSLSCWTVGMMPCAGYYPPKQISCRQSRSAAIVCVPADVRLRWPVWRQYCPRDGSWPAL